ncbi:hypothetical protein MTR67_041300 [Solanum verrucosum]|uniref:Endonuclease/exonuclease/phosphatase domain-containing protein n=1 Tax=Solanum verrucosum TaxID=315347 RepID=A0AAF0ZSL5_SOLVR|nr:hypothetical protein MTR67_041300 [Solanum verrucosum]
MENGRRTSPGKLRWPELIGVPAQYAKGIIEKENTFITDVQIILNGSPADFSCNRVRIAVNILDYAVSMLVVDGSLTFLSPLLSFLSLSLVFSATIEGCADQKQREDQLRPASLFLYLLLSSSEDDNNEQQLQLLGPASGEQQTPAKVRTFFSFSDELIYLPRRPVQKRDDSATVCRRRSTRSGRKSTHRSPKPSIFTDQILSILFLSLFCSESSRCWALSCRSFIPEHFVLVDLVSDGGSESCPRLRPRSRDKSGKGVTGSHNVRVGSWNIGSLTGKSIELVKILKKRKINIACVQETRWVGAKARDIDGFKLWYSGGSRDRNGVGILVDGDLREQVVEVRRINNRLMTIKLVIGGCTLSVISAYAPQVGLDEEAKKRFYEDLDEVVRGIPNTEKIVIGGDFNGHIGATSSGFDDVHGGFGFGERNRGGTSFLDFAKAFELVIANSCFPKKENHLVTFRSPVAKTQIDYLLLRKGDRGLFKDCKVIPSENLTTQHKLLVMDRRLRGIGGGR